MTGDDLGRRLDPPVSKQTIAHWEAGRYRPHIDQVAQLCGILHMSADALVLGGAGGLSPRGVEIAAMYDSLHKEGRDRVELMLMALGLSSEIEKNNVEFDREGIRPSNSSNQESTIKKAAPSYGPALTRAFKAAKGVRDADSQSDGLSKPRGGKRS